MFVVAWLLVGFIPVKFKKKIKSNNHKLWVNLAFYYKFLTLHKMNINFLICPTSIIFDDFRQRHQFFCPNHLKSQKCPPAGTMQWWKWPPPLGAENRCACNCHFFKAFKLGASWGRSLIGTRSSATTKFSSLDLKKLDKSLCGARAVVLGTITKVRCWCCSEIAITFSREFHCCFS